MIEVEDNGIGIDDAHRSRIFELDFRVDGDRAQGEGLGLSLAREAVLQMSGRVEVRSTPGIGSVFVVRLPGPAAG